MYTQDKFTLNDIDMCTYTHTHAYAHACTCMCTHNHTHKRTHTHTFNTTILVNAHGSCCYHCLECKHCLVSHTLVLGEVIKINYHTKLLQCVYVRTQRTSELGLSDHPWRTKSWAANKRENWTVITKTWQFWLLVWFFRMARRPHVA